MTGNLSLDEFAEAEGVKPGPKGYLDSLPEDVRRQLLESKVGHSAALRWLHSLGYERATLNIVTKWRQANGWSAR